MKHHGSGTTFTYEAAGGDIAGVELLQLEMLLKYLGYGLKYFFNGLVWCDISGVQCITNGDIPCPSPDTSCDFLCYSLL